MFSTTREPAMQHCMTGYKTLGKFWSVNFTTLKYLYDSNKTKEYPAEKNVLCGLTQTEINCNIRKFKGEDQ